MTRLFAWGAVSCVLVGCHTDVDGCTDYRDGDVVDSTVVIRTPEDARSCRGVEAIWGDLLVTSVIANPDASPGDPDQYHQLPENEDLEDLDDLSDLAFVAGRISVNENLGLQDVSGLSGIEAVDDGVVRIEQNPRLHDLSGFGEQPLSLDVVMIEGEIERVGMVGLESAGVLIITSTTSYDLHGMQGAKIEESLTLTGVRSGVEVLDLTEPVAVEIATSPELATLELPMLERVTSLSIHHNGSLTSVTAPQLVEVSDTLEIYDNPTLPQEMVEQLVAQADPGYAKTCGNLGSPPCP